MGDLYSSSHVELQCGELGIDWVLEEKLQCEQLGIDWVLEEELIAVITIPALILNV